MKIMSVNAGSSSLKFQILNMPLEEVICEGIIERIGNQNAFFKIVFQGQKEEIQISVMNHQQAIGLLLDSLIKNKIINNLTEIEGIGHRIVHGGDLFKDAVILTDDNIKKIESLNDLAPLHNPANILIVKLFKKFLPQVLQIGCFDTTFHNSMPEENFLYAVPYSWYENYKVRKYGFHGSSYAYVCQRAQQILNNNNLKMIICHAGNGVSLAAVKNNKSLDTSTGFTPLEGVPMGKRSGNIDPAIIPFIAKKEKKNIDEVLDILNTQSGYLGLSGVSHDCRDLEKMIVQKHRRSLLALNVQIKRIVDYIASYYVLLEGIDLLIFTGGIGENSHFFRLEIVKRLKVLNIFIDEKLNETNKGANTISTFDSAVKVMVIPTNEELFIARNVYFFKNNV